MNNIREEVRKMKLVSPAMASTSNEDRGRMLRGIAEALTVSKDRIFAANAEDVAAAETEGISPSIIKRLRFTEEKLRDCLSGIDTMIRLPDPTGKIELARELDEGLTLYRVTVPIGVIGVIFEARPDALVQISCLCIRSGNCAVLKGGRETAKTNKVLFDIIKAAAVQEGMPADALLQVSLHNEIDELLACDGDVDLLIPRGSNKFVQYIMNNTKIPVMGHADGVCHTYVDRFADQGEALRIIIDAKTQYAAACNATETVLIDRAILPEFLPKLKDALDRNHVRIHGTKEIADLTGCDVMADDSFHKEYLDNDISLKAVRDVKEAVDHINRFGSHHTDSILTENEENARYFLTMVDSAGVYQNCSTRFADGYRYGFGAEVGISTSKLHARGPVGLDGLVTYKYKLIGHGQIVRDYASGKKQFHHKDLPIQE